MSLAHKWIASCKAPRWKHITAQVLPQMILPNKHGVSCGSKKSWVSSAIETQVADRTHTKETERDKHRGTMAIPVCCL